MSPITKKAKILSTGAIQKILDEEKPGYRVVSLEPEPFDAADAAATRTSRSLPSLVEMQRKARSFTLPAEPEAEPEGSEADRWGNSSQFALIEPKGSASGDDTAARRRRTVIISKGKIVTEQG